MPPLPVLLLMKVSWAGLEDDDLLSAEQCSHVHADAAAEDART